MQSRSLHTETVKAAGDISENRFVTFGNKQASTAGSDALGVSVCEAKTGDLLAVDVIGTTIVEAGGTFARGDDLATDAEGKAVKAVSSDEDTEGDVVLAKALSAASSGQKVEILLKG